MSNFIHNLHIENFKSIKSLDLKCKRINVFVGKPNVGKSNILEAVGLYGLPYLMLDEELTIRSFVRLESFSDVFPSDSETNTLNVNSEMGGLIIKVVDQVLYYSLSRDKASIFKDHYKQVVSQSKALVEGEREILNGKRAFREIEPFYFSANGIDTKGFIEASNYVVLSPVKKYSFLPQESFPYAKTNSLLPPFGRNLITSLRSDKDLRMLLGDLLKEYGYEVVIDVKENKIEIQRRDEELVYKVPFSLIADTLQRFIFHLTAIKTNKNSILVLEEPESHSFPPYIQTIAEEIAESETNQFFIATHSPYLLNTLMEKTTYDEMAFFVTWYEDYETKARELTEEEVSQLMDYGIDIFFNLNAFLEKK